MRWEVALREHTLIVEGDFAAVDKTAEVAFIREGDQMVFVTPLPELRYMRKLHEDNPPV